MVAQGALRLLLKPTHPGSKGISMVKARLSNAWIFLSLFAPSSASANEEFVRLTPGEFERKDILDAARIRSASDLGIEDSGKVVFVVSRSDEGPRFCRSGDWALLSATAGQIEDGAWKPIDYACGDADLVSVFLLKKHDGAWQVRRGGSVCVTDVFWINWRHDNELGDVIPANLFDCFGSY